MQSNLPIVVQLVRHYSVFMDTEGSIGYLVHGRSSINRGLLPFMKEDNSISTRCCAVDNSGRFATFEQEKNLFQTLNSSGHSNPPLEGWPFMEGATHLPAEGFGKCSWPHPHCGTSMT